MATVRAWGIGPPIKTVPLFARRLVFWVASIFVSGVCGLIAIWYLGLPLEGAQGARQQRINDAGQLLQLGSEKHIERIRTLLKDKRGDVLILAENPLLAKALQRRGRSASADLAPIHQRLQRAYPDTYQALLLVTPDGAVRAASDPALAGQALAHESLRRAVSQAVQATQAGDGEVVAQVIWQGQAAIAITRPILTPANKPAKAQRQLGALMAVLSLTPFVNVQVDAALGPSAMALLDAHGQLLAERGHAGQRFTPDPKVPPGFEGVLIQARADQGEQLVAYRHFQLNATQGWTLVHFVDVDDVLASLWRPVLTVMVTGLLCCLLGVALIRIAARRVTRPLSQLARVAQRFGDGDLSARDAPAVGDSQEVAQLRQSFNTMAEHIEQAQHVLESKVVLRTAEARAARDKLLATLDALPDLLFELDRDGGIHEYHANSHELLALPLDKLIGHRLSDILPPEAARICQSALDEAARNGHCSGVEYTLYLPQGPLWFEASVVRKHRDDGAAEGADRFIFLSRDVTARRLAEEEVRRLAFMDPLTGLANRRLMLDRLDQACKAAARSGHYAAVVLMDLDHFKDLNDTRGHQVGDMLLVETARRLLDSVRDQDTVARLGGDEFVLVLTQFSTDPIAAWAEIEAVTEKVRSRVAEPFELLTLDGEHCQHHLTLSLGVCVFNGTQEAADELIKRADTAMYRAKGSGRNAISFFDQSMAAAIESKLALDEQLRSAVLEQQFYLCYQALRNATGHCLGAEVLVRWQHPRHGTVMPGEFIAAMERSGMIVSFGHWVLAETCRTLRRWADDAALAALAPLTLAVNVSARQLHTPLFVQNTLALLRESGIDPQRLKLELTESVLLEHTDEVIEKMSTLRAAGVRFALDDFGTGYSSLSYLKRLPLDLLKIDRTFVREVLIDANDAAIVRLIVGLGRSLGIPVLAEGIENAEQLRYMIRCGCKLFQGTHLGSPVRLADFEAMLQDEDPHAAVAAVP